MSEENYWLRIGEKDRPGNLVWLAKESETSGMLRRRTVGYWHEGDTDAGWANVYGDPLHFEPTHWRPHSGSPIDPAALARLRRENVEQKDEITRLRASGISAETKRLEKILAQVQKVRDTDAEIERLREALKIAVDRLKDMLEGDDGQAWSEAESAMPRLLAVLTEKDGRDGNGTRHKT